MKSNPPKETPGDRLTYEIVDGPAEAHTEQRIGDSFDDTLWVTPRALFRIRHWLECVTGRSVPLDREIDFAYSKYFGKLVVAEIVREGYTPPGSTQTRFSSKVNAYFSAEGFEQDTSPAAATPPAGKVDDGDDDNAF